MTKPKRKQVTILMPPLVCIGSISARNFWFFLPVPFLYATWPFKPGERLLITVERVK